MLFASIMEVSYFTEKWGLAPYKGNGWVIFLFVPTRYEFIIQCYYVNCIVMM